MASVTLTGVEKRFAALRVLEDVSLEIGDGEFVALVGPSGCGKSTLLRMIAGLEALSGGELRIDGQLMNDVPPKDRDIAMVFQSYALYPHMTAAENMGFSLRLRWAPAAETGRRVGEAAAVLNLSDYLARRPREMSGGQRQRVAMGRAIVREPKVFLFDEPLSNLDAALRVQMRTEIRSLHQRLGATAIYVTHDQIEAMTMADRIVVMRGGRIEQIGAPLDLYDHPANIFVAGFIGSPAMNFLPGRLVAGSQGLAVALEGAADGVLLLGGAAHLRPGQPVTVGLRPEHLQPTEDGRPALQAVVEILEPTGAETHVKARAGSASILAVIRDRLRLARGAPLRLTVEPRHIHLFGEDGRSLLGAPGAPPDRASAAPGAAEARADGERPLREAQAI